jgi:hypothetical protein
MSAIALALALLLPTACGAGVWWLLLGRPRGAFGWCAMLGAGYVVGCVGWGLVLTALGNVATPTLFARAAPWLSVALAALVVAAWRVAPHSDIPAGLPLRPTRLERVLWWSALLILMLTAASIEIQATALPTLTWDAWNAWLAKSKAWYFAGQFVPALAFEPWAASAPNSAIANEAWAYPEALPRFALWLASAWGGWHEPAVHLAWPLLWAALGLACYGYQGLAGIRPTQALLTTAGLLTLPLLTAHSALAGYVDLWLAAMLVLAGVHWLRWYRRRGWREATMTALCVILLPAIKPEGAIWLACFAAATVLCLLPKPWRWSLLLAGPLIWAAGLPFGGLRLPLPGLGLVRLGWGEVEIASRGVMNLSFRPVLEPVMQAMFLLPNWSLLWYLAPLALLLRWRRLPQRAELAAFAWFLALGYGFLVLLFFFTDASAWAEDFTSINRVLMQIVPITVVWLSLLWALPAPRDTASSTAP